MGSKPGLGSVERLFAMGGEVEIPLRLQNWSQSPLGMPDSWPQSLRTALGLCLSSPLPSAIVWGDRNLLLGNSPFYHALNLPITTQTVGQPLQRVHFQLWESLEPCLQRINHTGETIELDDTCWVDRFLQRHGYNGILCPILMEAQSIGGAMLTLLQVPRESGMSERERQRTEAILLQSEAFLSRANERFQLAAMAINALIYDWSIYTNRVERTEGLTRILGYSMEEAEPTMEWWRDRMHPEDVPRAEQQFWDAIARGDRFSSEYRVRNKANQYIYVLDCGIVACRDAEGNPTRIVGSTTDITMAKQSEAERDRLLKREQAAREEAERANRIKDEFLTVLSHELRSPLNPILGWATLLQSRKVEGPILKQAVDAIERNSKLQLRLIDDLLDISRILRGKLRLEREAVDLASVVVAAMETVHLSAEAKGIQITMHLAQVDPVLGDEGRLQQVVWNLLSNAVKFTPAGGQIEVSLSQVENQAQIQVRDTGKGIAPAFLPHVFDHFQQEDGGITRKFGGLGLGLAIARYLTELHGGQARAESLGEDRGATFTILLPTLSPSQSLELQGSSTQLLLLEGLSLQGLRVLLVEDEQDSRDFIQYALEEMGVLVTAVASVKEALTAFRRDPPHLLVSDIAMPDLDGYALIQYVRSLTPEQGGQVPAIALTAYAGEGDARKALRVGFQHHLPKPIVPHHLYQAIAELIQPDMS